jgi:hypothetical protein
MKVRLNESEIDNSVLLSSVNSGKVIRFSNTTVESAIAEEGEGFWLVISSPELKDSRKRLASIKDGTLIERDGSHRVIVEDVSLVINVLK